MTHRSPASALSALPSPAEHSAFADRLTHPALYDPDAFIRQATARLVHQIEPQSRGVRQFLEAIFDPRVRDASQLAHMLGVRPSTLNCRFLRVGLPSPKRYIVFARLVRATCLAQSSPMTVAAIAQYLDASSPQSFTRTVQRYLGVTAGTFVRTWTGEMMLARLEAELITPYRTILQTFDPVRPRE